jgi:sarcosine oxidase/L-pipecolate oxidase
VRKHVFSFPFSKPITDKSRSPRYQKVVRTSYADVFYAQLARGAIKEWKKTDEWGDTYRE